MEIFVCKGCDHFFNKESQRAPMILTCSHKICNQCLQQRIQNKIQSNTFECPKNPSHLIDKNSQFTEDEDLLEHSMLYLQNNNNLTIRCSKHQQKMIETLCTIENQIQCIACSCSCKQKNKHINLTSQRLNDFFNEKIIPKIEQKQSDYDSKICEFERQIQIIKDKQQKVRYKMWDLEAYKKKIQLIGKRELLIDSDKFMDTLEYTCRKITKDETSNMQLKNFDFKDLQADIIDLAQPQSEQRRNKVLLSDLSGSSSQSESLQSEESFERQNNGFKTQDFHRCCNKQGPTICFILSENGNIFGGYTSVQWMSSGGLKPDKNSFIFSLTNWTIHPNKKDNQIPAIYHGSGYCWNQGGLDLNISDQSNRNKASFCKIGKCFEFSNENLNRGNSNKFLAGLKKFRVIEIEVYKVRCTQ
ncbi:tldc domain-containing protein [Stylonychia lemnae]|uniref:Tldc domain-containing protein n=1 Tax=Stylonychia lemnae TaxID=5949 RepID=A0A077ZXL2_STYLE|nr:tldc domain-containing protein [Stylonychia lemnae]|eukprot:CDW73286.1 tldc domain-containing protein [Stylonychia lemnae]